ncbi:MAG: hypothetical protein HZB71_13790 [Betaproteobacteria bacterium]|nr:hypothetical protein [Betaproteobacteria bacterium]
MNALFALACAGFSGQVLAVGDWSLNGEMNASGGTYSGSQLRDRVSGYGATLSADYLERGGLTLGLSRSFVKMKPGSNDIKQSSVFTSGRMHLTPDSLPGRLTLRLDLHKVDNDDVSRDTDEVSAYAPQVAWLSPDRQTYMDLGYAKSRYQNNLKVTQYTPTFGKGLNDGADWMQFRAYLIDMSNAARAQGKSATFALESKWTHWFGPKGPIGLDNVRAGLLLGSRVYAVDPDGGSVSNLADSQRGDFNVAGEWKLGQSSSILAILGHGRFRNATLSNDYTLNYGYVSWSGKW